MPKLDVYISDSCWSCEETPQIVADIRKQFPDIEIVLLDIDPAEWPQEIFAVPTYVLDGKVISLGNPSRERLETKLAAVCRL